MLSQHNYVNAGLMTPAGGAARRITKNTRGFPPRVQREWDFLEDGSDRPRSAIINNSATMPFSFGGKSATVCSQFIAFREKRRPARPGQKESRSQQEHLGPSARPGQPGLMRTGEGHRRTGDSHISPKAHSCANAWAFLSALSISYTSLTRR